MGIRVMSQKPKFHVLGLFIQPNTLLPKLLSFYDTNSLIVTTLFFITKTLEHLYSYGPSTTYCFNYFSVIMDCTFPFASFLADTFNFINPAPQCKLLKSNEPRLNVFFACTARFMQTYKHRCTNTKQQPQSCIFIVNKNFT